MEKIVHQIIMFPTENCPIEFIVEIKEQRVCCSKQKSVRTFLLVSPFIKAQNYYFCYFCNQS